MVTEQELRSAAKEYEQRDKYILQLKDKLKDIRFDRGSRAEMLNQAYNRERTEQEAFYNRYKEQGYDLISIKNDITFEKQFRDKLITEESQNRLLAAQAQKQQLAQANFQNQNGNIEQVNYTFSNVAGKVPNNGITQALDKKGAFGVPFASKEIGYSGSNIAANPNVFQESAFDIKQNFYDLERKRAERNTFSEQLSQDKQTAGYLLGEFDRTNDQRKLSEFTITRPVVYAGFGVKAAGNAGEQFFTNKIEAGDSSLATKGAFYSSRVVRGFGAQLQTDPSGSIKNAGLYGLGSAAAGSLVGVGVRGLAGKGFVNTAQTINVGQNVLFAGSVGAALYTTPANEVGASLPSVIAGGAGYTKAYRSIIRPTSVAFEPIGRATTKTNAYTLTGRQSQSITTQRIRYYADELGIIKSGTRTATMEASTPLQSDYGLIRYNIKTSVPYRSVSGEKVALGNYKGVYDPQQLQLSGIDDNSNAFSVKASNTVFRYDDGSTMQEVVGLRTTMFNNERVVSVTEGLNFREAAKTQQVTLLPDMHEVKVGFGFERNMLTGTTKQVITTPSNVRLVQPLQQPGYELLHRGGLYDEGRTPGIRRAGNALVDGFDQSFLNPRTKRFYSGTVLEPLERPTTTFPTETGAIEGGRFHNVPQFNRVVQPDLFGSRVSLLPLSGTFAVNRATYKQLPRTNAAVSSIQTFDILPRSDTITRSDTRTDTSFTPRFDTITRTDTIPRNGFTPRFDFTGGRVPIPPPPVTGGFPSVPNFAPPRGKSTDILGGKQSFRYAPSITAGIFNLRGKATKGVLSGLEVRPLSRSRGRK